MQKWVKENHILMYSSHNEGNSLVSEVDIRHLKNKIYNQMTANDCYDWILSWLF